MTTIPAGSSRYEKNIFLQPSIILETLERPIPEWVSDIKKRRMFFVGIGTSYHAAQIAKFLWQDYVSPDVYAVNSFDFVKTRQPIGVGDVVVVFSHRGTKSYSVESANVAHRAGAITIGVTCQGSPWRESLTHRVETCEPEDTGGFTKSFTCAMACIVRWIDDPVLTQRVKAAVSQMEAPVSFPAVKATSDVVLIGDLTREWVAREIALKIQEIAYVPARAFGLEEFLHGPRVSVGDNSVVIAFCGTKEIRWNSAFDYLKRIGAPMQRVEGSRISQLFWGQRFALDICKRLNIDPDSLRTDDERYKEARANLVM